MSDPIDVRSDTVTRPDEAMLQAMCSAPLGDDVFGDDPTVCALEERAAELAGKEAGLFTPSGTMANSIAIACHTRPGDEVILEALCHSFNFECAAAARLWGVQSRVLEGDRGFMSPDQIESAIRPENIHLPHTSLVILEQTSNIAGGCVLPLDGVKAVGELCRARGLKFHMDGARAFHAVVATGRPLREIVEPADSMMFCISKGLGAPVGSLLVGRRDFIDRARRIRKTLGGGMRQAGILAAAGLHALENNVDRLAEDHRRCREVAESLEPLRARGLQLVAPETNMIYLVWQGADSGDYARFAARLGERGVLAVPLLDHGVRLVFHKDVSESDAAEVSATLRCLLPEVLHSPGPNLPGPGRRNR